MSTTAMGEGWPRDCEAFVEALRAIRDDHEGTAAISPALWVKWARWRAGDALVEVCPTLEESS